MDQILSSNDSSWLAWVLQFPPCTFQCMQSANKYSGCGNIADIKCICTNGFTGLTGELYACFNRTAPCAQQEYDYFSSLAYNTCKQHRTAPFPTFDATKTSNSTTGTSGSASSNKTDLNRSSSNAPASSNNSSLPPGAYAGIGVGAGAATFGLAMLAMVLLKRRKKAQKVRAAQQIQGNIPLHELVNTDLKEMPGVREHQEPRELHVMDFKTGKPVELDSSQSHELEAKKR